MLVKFKKEKKKMFQKRKTKKTTKSHGIYKHVILFWTGLGQMRWEIDRRTTASIDCRAFLVDNFTVNRADKSVTSLKYFKILVYCFCKLWNRRA